MFPAPSRELSAFRQPRFFSNADAKVATIFKSANIFASFFSKKSRLSLQTAQYLYILCERPGNAHCISRARYLSGTYQSQPPLEAICGRATTTSCFETIVPPILVRRVREAEPVLAQTTISLFPLTRLESPSARSSSWDTETANVRFSDAPKYFDRSISVASFCLIQIAAVPSIESRSL